MQLCCFHWILLFLGCFLSSVPELTECAELSITVEQNTTIHINMTSTQSECEVCIIQDTQWLCKPSVIISSDTLLKFSCSQPENVFTVHIITDVGWIHYIHIKPKEYPAFQKFNRTFSWNIEPPLSGLRRPYNLDFYRVGLRQISHTDDCPDKHIYTITAKTAVVGRFCQNGNIKEANVHYGKVSLEVFGGQLLSSKGFAVVLLPSDMGELAEFLVMFSKKGTEDISVNYPSSPSESIVWHISVPPLYQTRVHVLNYTIPACLNASFPKMKYMWQNHYFLTIKLTDIQPLEESGNLLLMLENCETLEDNAAQNGLMVHFQISAVLRTKGQCTGRVPENQTLQIRVKRKDPISACFLKLGSVILETVTIDSGNYFELNIFDCNKNELELTINQTIERKEWQNCSNTSLPLVNEPHCVPGILKTITWHLHGPENSAVELHGASGFCQSMPEQKCNSDILIDVSHNNRGFTVGQFCVNGDIQSIQIHDSNIAVSFTNINDRSQLNLPTISYLFKRELSEDYIFTVAPKNHYPVLLLTPAWPSGMNPSYTVSWIVTLDPKLKSKLKFMNLSKPICKERSTSVSITVQSIDSQQTLYSTNKDSDIKELRVSESFYLNMTNCKSPTGDFKSKMLVTLQYSSNQLLAMSMVGILLVMVITAMVVCFILRRKRKRKSNRAPPTSICNNDVNAVLPGLNDIPVDPHIYTYIDDTHTYYSILKNTKNQCEERPTDGSGSPQSDTPLPDRPIIKGPTITDNMLIDNELYGATHRKSTTSE